MNKPEPKVLFIIKEEQSANSVCFLVETLPHIVKAIKDADLDDIISNKVGTHNPNLMRLYTNSCYDATEVRAYLEHLLTEAHETWLETGGIDTETDTDVTRLQELLTSSEVMLGHYVHVLEEVKEAAKQGAELNYIIKVIESTLEPRRSNTTAAPETSDG